VPREAYQEALDALRQDVGDLGQDVLTQLDHGLRALENGDAALGEAVVDGDASINQRYLGLESDCIDLFALQQPVAGDLRFLAATFKILTDLERVGDLATNLGIYAQATTGDTLGDIAVTDIGRDAQDLVGEALDQYLARESRGCRAIAARDDQIDIRCQRASDTVVRDLIEREAGSLDGWTVERLLDDVSRLLLTIRDLERVADHGVNIAARTYYMVENDAELIE
jgi:phosphate transport system protein